MSPSCAVSLTEAILGVGSVRVGYAASVLMLFRLVVFEVFTQVCRGAGCRLSTGSFQDPLQTLPPSVQYNPVPLFPRSLTY